MPRLFCSLKIPADLRRELSSVKGALSGARWVEPENYHITLLFFGDISRPIADDLCLAFSGIDRHQFSLEVDQLDVFGSSKPRSLYARIKQVQPLIDLHNEIEWIARRLKIKIDNRKFSPHITLARLSGTTPLELAGFIGARGGFQSEPFDIDEFQLLSSKASIGGGPYVTEVRYPLRQFEI